MTILQSAEVYASQGDDQFIFAIKPEIVGFSYRKFYCQHPICDVHEMAWATSMQCRFTGHVRRRYSVSEHCILVALLMSEPKIAERGGTRFEALMHDQHEGYVSDLAAPWKVTVRDYKPFESKIEAAMRAQFGLPEKISEGVKYADWVALFIEAEQLLGKGASDGWLEPEPGTRDYALSLYNYRVRCDSEYDAYNRFMRYYTALVPIDLKAVK